MGEGDVSSSGHAGNEAMDDGAGFRGTSVVGIRAPGAGMWYAAS